VLHGQLSFYETFPLGGASVQKQVNNMHTRTQIHRHIHIRNNSLLAPDSFALLAGDWRWGEGVGLYY